MSIPQDIVDKLEEQRKRKAICPVNLLGKHVRHNFDIGLFLVVEDDMGMRVRVRDVPSPHDAGHNFCASSTRSYSVDSLRPA